jgi:hypothetical protein
VSDSILCNIFYTLFKNLPTTIRHPHITRRNNKYIKGILVITMPHNTSNQATIPNYQDYLDNHLVEVQNPPDDGDDYCPICMEPLTDAPPVVHTVCGEKVNHYFHRQCLLDWFNNGQIDQTSDRNSGQIIMTCPTCRKQQCFILILASLPSLRFQLNQIVLDTIDEFEGVEMRRPYNFLQILPSLFNVAISRWQIDDIWEGQRERFGWLSRTAIELCIIWDLAGDFTPSSFHRYFDNMSPYEYSALLGYVHAQYDEDTFDMYSEYDIQFLGVTDDRLGGSVAFGFSDFGFGSYGFYPTSLWPGLMPQDIIGHSMTVRGFGYDVDARRALPQVEILRTTYGHSTFLLSSSRTEYFDPEDMYSIVVRHHGQGSVRSVTTTMTSLTRTVSFEGTNGEGVDVVFYLTGYDRVEPTLFDRSGGFRTSTRVFCLIGAEGVRALELALMHFLLEDHNDSGSEESSVIERRILRWR